MLVQKYVGDGHQTASSSLEVNNMAQANFTPIQLYRSTTASAAPTAVNLADGELAINTNDGKLYYKDSGGSVQLIASKAGASGDVVGPASATDNAVVRFDGTTGKLVQNSVVTIADSTGDVAGVGALTASGNLTLSGGTANGVLYLNGSKVTTSGSALTFDGSNLGLGVTPSASNLPTFESEYGLISGKDEINIIQSAYYDSGFKYSKAEAAGRYLINSGIHSWYTAPSGTAGNAISFTQAMTLDASGNLFVNGTTQIAGAKLNVRGTGSYIGVGGTVETLFGDSGGSEGFIGSFTNHAFVFRTNNTERARITSGGYFKASNAGTYQNSAAAYHELRQTASDWVGYFVNTNATPYGIQFGHITDANSTGSPFFQCTAGAALGTLRAEIRSNGGLANYQSNNVDLSDIRTKIDINPLGSYWSKIAGLEIVTYKYKDQTHDDLNIGVIAQQVEQVAPEFVDSDGFGETPEDGAPLKTIYNKDLTFAAIKALQEAMTRIETLEAKVAQLEGTQP